MKSSRGMTALVWITLIAIVIVVIISRSGKSSPPTPVSADAAAKLLDAGMVESYRLDGRNLVLSTRDGQSLGVYAPAPNSSLLTKLGETDVPLQAADDSPLGGNTVTILLVAAAVLVGLVILGKRTQSGKSFTTVFELRKSRARPVAEADKAKFTDIGGNRQAVELVADIVDFLRDPQRWIAAGLRIPRGLLVVGPPGTGKTLLARAVAGETQAAYFYTSAAEFVELFVGVGAARVRDTFDKAAKQQPAVIFIDELDAVGRRRGSGTGTMHEEREQTLNQLLVLLDGMEKHARLVVMAATNRPDVLDAALLRSGRFDRVLRLELPTEAERLEILKIHVRNKPLDPQLSLAQIAAETESFSGADLEALVNAAGLRAVRRTRDGGNHRAVTVTAEDFETARREMIKSNRFFDRLDSVLVDSASQFTEPTGRALARIALVGGEVVEGQVMWMNADHIKLKLADGREVIVAKANATQITALEGTETARDIEFTPDRWAERTLEAS